MSLLTESDIGALVQLYYSQLEELNAPIISVVIDKRYLRPFVSPQWLHGKAWEYLCERVEMFMAREHPKHRAILVANDTGKNQNCALAMKHAQLLERATSAGRHLTHIVEMPLFVRSELSEGVQLADLCAYSIYRAFRRTDLQYKYLQPVLEQSYALRIFPRERRELLIVKGGKDRGQVESTRPALSIDVQRGEPYQAASSTGRENLKAQS